ncbi:MAG: hypothetical protein EOO10_19550 [Chitinophagaceae bacterium]|nr:MAG: hypothetical protein EOO10_19550 [Chitinophagaceae bacterium]
MKGFKEIDFWIQVVLMVLCTLLALTQVFLFVYAYFIVGSWQVLSTLIHLAMSKSFFQASGRKYYHYALIMIAVSGIVVFFVESAILPYLVALLIVSPFLAFWYAYMCNEENKTLARKAYVHLK